MTLSTDIEKILGDAVYIALASLGLNRIRNEEFFGMNQKPDLNKTSEGWD